MLSFRTIQKLVCILGFAFLVGASTVESAPPTDGNRTTFRAVGASAELSFYSSRELIGFLQVSRGGNTRESETFLVYILMSRVTGLPIYEGEGRIPNEAFTTHGNVSQLTVDLSTLPEFTILTGTPIQIDVTWTSDGIYRERIVGNIFQDSPGFKLHQVGTRTTETASVNGVWGEYAVVSPEVLGSTIADNNVTITVEH